MSSSENQCNRYIFSVSLNQALKQAVWTTIVYLFVFFIPFLKSGFTDIGGDTLMANSIGEGFILAFTSIILSLVNYFDSKKLGCELNRLEAEKQFNMIENKLSNEKTETAKVNDQLNSSIGKTCSPPQNK